MFFIQRLITLLRYRDHSLISDELWLEFLENGATEQEIQWHFGSTESVDHRIRRLTPQERRQYSIYSTLLSSRMALWWVLKERQDHSAFRASVGQSLAYPSLLMGLALVMMGLLNHVMLPRMNGLFEMSSSSHPGNSGFSGLLILEIVTLTMFIGVLVMGLIPQRHRIAMVIRFYHQVVLKDYRIIINTRFMSWMIRGLQQGLSGQTILTLLKHANDPILRHWSMVIHQELECGRSLADAAEQLDPRLKPLFVMNENDQSIDVRLQRHFTLMTLRLNAQIKRWRNVALGWAYFNFGIIILYAYQMMFEPIRQLEQLL